MSKGCTSRRPLRAVAMLMGIALLIWLIARTGTGAVMEHAKAVGWGMVLVLLLGGLSHLVRTWAWRLTFRSNIREVSVANTFALRLISEAIGNFGLAGQVVGDTVRVSLLGPKVPIADRISSVALDRVLYTVSSAIVGVIGVLACVLLLPLSGRWQAYALAFAASLAVFLVLIVVSFTRGWRVLSGPTHAIQQLSWAKQWGSGKASVIESIEQNLLTFHSQAPTSFWVAMFLYISSQVMAVAEVYLLLRFMGVRVTFIGALVIEAFTKLISVVGAVNPGNIGTFEGGNLLLARMLHFAPAAGMTLAICRRARTLFWAGIGALCLIVLSRGKERGMPESIDGPQAGNTGKPLAAGEIDVQEFDRSNTLAVIVVVDDKEGTSGFRPALATVGALPVSLRAILTAQKLSGSRLIVSVPSAVANIVMHDLLRSGRLPQSVEWHERKSGADLCTVVREAACTSDQIVLLSGSNVYKPSLLSTAADWKATTGALVFKMGTRPAGLCCLSRGAALAFAEHGNIDSVEDGQSWIEANCETTIAQAPRDHWQAIIATEDCTVAEHKLDTWMFKPTDGIFACFNRRISIPISRQLIKTPITPNAVTFMILAVSIAAAVLFARGGYWNILAGALLSVWASILDGCDGEVARYKLLSSKLGSWLDTICDYLYYLMTFVGITWGLNKTSGGNTYLMWGAALVMGAFLSFFVVSFMRRRVAADDPGKFLARFQDQAESRSANPLVFVARNCEFIIRRCFFPYALLVAALLNIMKPIFVITAVGANLVWIIALYSCFALKKKHTSPGYLAIGLQPHAGD